MRKLLGLIALALSLIASPLAAQTASSGQAFRLAQTVTDPAVGTSNDEINTATAEASFPGVSAANESSIFLLRELSFTAFGAGLREKIFLGGSENALQATATASATEALGTARVNNVNFDLGTDDISMLNIFAQTVQSTSTATVSPLDTTGTTTIVGLQLTGSVFGPTNTLTLTAEQQAALTAGTPNIVVFNQDGLKITLNRQVETTTPNADGTTTLALAVDAIAVEFNDFALGTGLKNGEVVFASSSASVTTAQPISPQ